MGKGYNNYMCKKPFHPGSKANIKRTWMAEQRTENEKKKQDELKVQYEKEQDLYNNRALISNESKDKLELNFMYEAPPGAKRERQKEDDEPEYKFEWQRKYNAPREDFAKGNTEIRDQPFGIPVRNVRCIKCHKWGHINTDKECPLFSQASTSSMPATSMDPLELMRQMREDGFNLKQSVLGHHLNPQAANQQLLESEEEDPEIEFLRSLSSKQKRKLLRKLNKRISKQKKSDSSCSKKKKSKKKPKSRRKSLDTESEDEKETKKAKKISKRPADKRCSSSEHSDSVDNREEVTKQKKKAKEISKKQSDKRSTEESYSESSDSEDKSKHKKKAKKTAKRQSDQRSTDDSSGESSDSVDSRKRSSTQKHKPKKASKRPHDQRSADENSDLSDHKEEACKQKKEAENTARGSSARSTDNKEVKEKRKVEQQHETGSNSCKKQEEKSIASSSKGTGKSNEMEPECSTSKKDSGNLSPDKLSSIATKTEMHAKQEVGETHHFQHGDKRKNRDLSFDTDTSSSSSSSGSSSRVSSLWPKKVKCEPKVESPGFDAQSIEKSSKPPVETGLRVPESCITELSRSPEHPDKFTCKTPPYPLDDEAGGQSSVATILLERKYQGYKDEKFRRRNRDRRSPSFKQKYRLS